MCEVCAIFGVAGHWTDAAPIGTSEEPARAIQRHRVERRRRIDLLNTWLADRRVTVQDWNGEAFVVLDAAGRMRVAADLSALWAVVESLSGSPFDPLSEEEPFGTRPAIA
ncbi:MAG TPA: hypothetical protein VMV45_12750 [Casimicrobiaceae bacterium]|nr:hypothetical protein [Casimicrobiaceae bacterium]